MKRSTKRFLHGSTLAVGLTGVIWAWMRYLFDPGPEPDDPELMMRWTGSHGLEPLTRTLHLFSAPLSVFAVGFIWQSHVAPRLWKPWARRRTGLLLVVLFAPMVLSGVALQTAPSSAMRDLWVWTHGISGGIWFLGYGIHLASGGQRRSSRVT